MPNWTFTFDVADIWGAATDRKLTPSRLAAEIANRLEKQIPGRLKDAGLEDLIMSFRLLAADTDGDFDDPDFDDFDCTWEEFYDWADKKRVRVKTSL